jgi:hypothetical protein
MDIERAGEDMPIARPIGRKVVYIIRDTVHDSNTVLCCAALTAHDPTMMYGSR